MDDLAVSKAGGKLIERFANGGDAFENGCVGQDGHIVFGEIDAGFEHGDQLNQLLLDRLQTPGESAFKLLRGDLRLVERLRVDEIADRFGLCEIDAAVEEGAHGELSGLGEAGSGGNAEFDDVARARPASRGRRSR